MSYYKRLVRLNVMMAILPESKVRGVDMFGRKTKKAGLMLAYQTLQTEAQETLGLTRYNALMDAVQERTNDILQEMYEREEGLHQNETVDDPNLNFELMAVEDNKNAFFNMKKAEHQIYSVADEEQKRHERMVMRLAIIEKLNKNNQKDLIKNVTDSLVERVLNGEHEWDESLKDYQVSSSDIAAKEIEILRKNNSAHFRENLQSRAEILKNMAARAVMMKKGKIPMEFLDKYTKVGSSLKRQTFVDLVIKLANRTKIWCELRQNNPRPYSKRAINALYNTAVLVLTDMGVFKEALLRREYNPISKKFDGPVCSFDKKVREDMVEVKSGLNWQEETAMFFYEQNDGNTYNQVNLFS